MALVPLSTRLPINIVAQLEAMAAKSGKSRNSMVALLLDAGLESVKAHLDKDTLKQLKALESKSYEELLSKTETGETY